MEFSRHGVLKTFSCGESITFWIQNVKHKGVFKKYTQGVLYIINERKEEETFDIFDITKIAL